MDDLLTQKPIPDDVVTDSDAYWMRLALAQAEQAAALGEVPVGAVAVLNESVIGTGFNRKEADLDPLAHAEMIALKAAATAVHNWRLIGVTLYCTLEPCPMCAGAMIQARLPRLVYGARDTRFGADGSVVSVLRAPEFNHRVAITSGVLEEEAAALLQRFFQELRERRMKG
ncbi:MAG: tRNA adenosine(34) deaminase TadA [Ardenticatenaceae bacterium]|nr:tRNA adenosine(34) deaminase TadA [Ardenticatenaceae bacterium]